MVWALLQLQAAGWAGSITPCPGPGPRLVGRSPSWKGVRLDSGVWPCPGQSGQTEAGWRCLPVSVVRMPPTAQALV